MRAIGVSRHVDDLERRIARGEFGGDLIAAPARHDDVGEEEMRRLAEAREEPGRLLAVRGLVTVEAELRQGGDGEVAHAGLVLDDDDALLVAARERRRALLGLGGARGDRQIDREGGAAAQDRVDVDDPP